MKRLTLIQRRLTHYRVAFFEELRSVLSGKGVELTLGCGCGTADEQCKNDAGVLSWAQPLKTTYWAGGRVCFQPFDHLLKGSDMLVVTAENKLVNNLLYQFNRSPLRVALWGHGANLQGNPSSVREWLKRRVARRADWWFGYTEMSRPLVAQCGFPEERITILNNSVDTSEMAGIYERLPAGDRVLWRRINGVGDGPVGIFLGSIYAEKRLDFLLQAATRVRAAVPGFELVVVGSGPQESVVQDFCAAHDWAHYLGVRSGVEKVRALASSDVMLNPGLVGLGILDSFVCGVPMVTTDCGLHSPEISYLESGRNGLMTSNDMAAYVNAVGGLLAAPNALVSLADACRESGRRYSIANMAGNFADGVEACLNAPIRRWGQ